MQRFFIITVIITGIFDSCQSDSSLHHTIHVCNSGLPLLNGVYKQSPEHASDGISVYMREDTEEELADDAPEIENDYRLFRHKGYWTFADFETWPPTTLYRCNPYIGDTSSIKHCVKFSQNPPMVGFTTGAKGTASSPILSLYQECREPESNETTTRGEL